MSEVLRACAVFFLYAAAAMFAENAVFSRALGVSRLVKLVDDSTVDTLVFGGLMCAVQLISAPLAKVANRLIQPFEFRSAIRPLVFILCSAVAFAVVPVKDSDTGSWSFGVLKNPGQYCAVLGFGLVLCLLQLLADAQQLAVDLRYGSHIDIQLDTHLLTEDVDQLDGRSGGTAREIPNVGIHDIRPADDGRQHRSQAVTRRAVRMEIHRHFKIMFEQAYQPGHPFGRNQAAHVLNRDHIGSQSLHLKRFIQEVFICKNRLMQRMSV